MNAAEIKEILSSGKTEVYAIDPQHKSEITRATLATIDRTIKKSLSAKRSVKIIVVS